MDLFILYVRGMFLCMSVFICKNTCWDLFMVTHPDITELLKTTNNKSLSNNCRIFNTLKKILPDSCISNLHYSRPCYHIDQVNTEAFSM